MQETESEGRTGLGAAVGRVVYRQTSRRGFLAKAGAALVGASAIGVIGLIDAEPAEAGGACCTGSNCVDVGCGCPGISKCSTGCSWTGYTWTCCGGGHLVYCSDCTNSKGTLCSCAYVTHLSCDAKKNMTATEISGRAASAA